MLLAFPSCAQMDIPDPGSRATLLADLGQNIFAWAMVFHSLSSSVGWSYLPRNNMSSLRAEPHFSQLLALTEHKLKACLPASLTTDKVGLIGSSAGSKGRKEGFAPTKQPQGARHVCLALP